jgi:hypothetical protein
LHNGVYHITGKLWRQYAEIVGEYYKNKAQHKMPAVFPKIFIERGKMFHSNGKGKIKQVAYFILKSELYFIKD